MWLCKLKLRHSDCLITSRAEKYNVPVLSYPMGWYDQREIKYSTTICFFESVDKDAKHNLLEDLKKDKRITNLEISGDVFVYQIKLGKHGQHVMLYYERKLFFPKPVINSPDGFEYWEIGSWNKDDITNFIKHLKKNMDVCEVLFINQTKLSELYFPNVMPNLSEEQKNSLKMAYANNYYTYPRKIKIEELAKLAKKSTSTFQEHLRKAEIKIMPNFIENYLVKKKKS